MAQAGRFGNAKNHRSQSNSLNSNASNAYGKDHGWSLDGGRASFRDRTEHGSACGVDRYSSSRSIFGKVIGDAMMPISEVCRKVVDLWVPLGAVDVAIIGRDGVRVLFASEKDRNGVISRAPWWLGEAMLLLSLDPIPDFRGKETLPPTPVWVQLQGINAACFEYNLILNAANELGKIVEIQLEMGNMNLPEGTARVKIMLNTNNPVKVAAQIRSPDEEWVNVKVRFELWVLCEVCGRITHPARRCPTLGHAGDVSERMKERVYTELTTRPIKSGINRVLSTKVLTDLYTLPVPIKRTETGCLNLGGSILGDARMDVDYVQKPASLREKKRDGKATYKVKKSVALSEERVSALGAKRKETEVEEFMLTDPVQSSVAENLSRATAIPKENEMGEKTSDNTHLPIDSSFLGSGFGDLDLEEFIQNMDKANSLDLAGNLGIPVESLHNAMSAETVVTKGKAEGAVDDVGAQDMGCDKQKHDEKQQDKKKTKSKGKKVLEAVNLKEKVRNKKGIHIEVEDGDNVTSGIGHELLNKLINALDRVEKLDRVSIKTLKTQSVTIVTKSDLGKADPARGEKSEFQGPSRAEDENQVEEVSPMVTGAGGSDAITFCPSRKRHRISPEVPDAPDFMQLRPIERFNLLLDALLKDAPDPRSAFWEAMGSMEARYMHNPILAMPLQQMVNPQHDSQHSIPTVIAEPAVDIPQGPPQGYLTSN